MIGMERNGKKVDKRGRACDCLTVVVAEAKEEEEELERQEGEAEEEGGRARLLAAKEEKEWKLVDGRKRRGSRKRNISTFRHPGGGRTTITRSRVEGCCCCYC